MTVLHSFFISIIAISLQEGRCWMNSEKSAFSALKVAGISHAIDTITHFHSHKHHSKDVHVEEFLQPDNADELEVLYTENVNNLSCTRECTEGSSPRTCYYRFVMEQYSTLNVACGNCPDNITDCFQSRCITADGYERGVLSVNRRIPGPGIQVCLGDRLIIDVINNMPGKQTAIHWHGLYMKEEPYMDGATMVTQCSILSEQTFRYDFHANNAGTFFWHSHDGFQKMDGLVGNLVVRLPRKIDPNGHLYDYDLPSHVVMIMDWYYLYADSHFPGLRTHDRSQDAQSYLIGGRGRNKKTSGGSKYPLSVYRVAQGKRYRFRLIGALCSECPVRVKIESHKMLVIATDGKPIKPIVVDTVVLVAGMRYDVVINASETIGSYWIRVQGLAECAWYDVQQLAILQYNGYNFTEPSNPPVHIPYYPSSKELNAENATYCGPGEFGVCLHQLTGNNVPRDCLKTKPDIDLMLKFDMHYFNKEELIHGEYYKFQQPARTDRQLSGEINNISSLMPPAPLLSQEEDVPSEVICPVASNGTVYCPKENCHCVHMLHIPLGSVVQLVLVDQSRRGGLNHPFHLHGYSFAVMEMGNYEKARNLKKALKEFNSRNLSDVHTPPLLDTIPVPNQGYAIIKFKADNPGFWLLHCHILNHQESGMFVTFKIGNKSDFPPVSKDFPRCGNYIPKFEPSEDGDKNSASQLSCFPFYTLLYIVVIKLSMNI